MSSVTEIAEPAGDLHAAVRGRRRAPTGAPRPRRATAALPRLRRERRRGAAACGGRLGPSSASLLRYAAMKIVGARGRDRCGEVPPRARPRVPPRTAHRRREHRGRHHRCTACTSRPTSTPSRYWLGGRCSTASAAGAGAARPSARRRSSGRSASHRRLVQPRRPGSRDPPRSGRSCSHEGRSLSEVTAALCATRFGIDPGGDPDDRRRRDHADRRRRSRPASRSTCTSRSTGWQRHAARSGERDPVRGRRARAPAPGVLDAIARADVLVLCPSNPVVSIGPILAVPGVREAVAARRGPVVGVSPIVGGAPLAGMADRLMPVAGLEVSALGAARAYRDLLSGVGDRRARRRDGAGHRRRARDRRRRHRHGHARRRRRSARWRATAVDLATR